LVLYIDYGQSRPVFRSPPVLEILITTWRNTGVTFADEVLNLSQQNPPLQRELGDGIANQHKLWKKRGSIIITGYYSDSSADDVEDHSKQLKNTKNTHHLG
jgi:hypothetical protein